MSAGLLLAAECVNSGVWSVWVRFVCKISHEPVRATPSTNFMGLKTTNKLERVVSSRHDNVRHCIGMDHNIELR